MHALLSRFFWVVFPYQSLLISLIQEVLMALEHNAYLGRDDLGKLLRVLLPPCILSAARQPLLYNIVDQIFTAT